MKGKKVKKRSEWHPSFTSVPAQHARAPLQHTSLPVFRATYNPTSKKAVYIYQRW